MASLGSIGKSARPWRRVGLAALLLGLVALFVGLAFLAYRAPTILVASESVPKVARGVQPSPAPDQVPPEAVPVKSRLVFPRQQALTFKTPGEVGEVMVREGERVVEGQVLALLDRTMIIELEEIIGRDKLRQSQLQKTLDQARREFRLSPLEEASFNSEVANARKALKDAEELREDFQLAHSRAIANATAARANAELALFGVMQPGATGGMAGQGMMGKSSEEALSDFESDYQRQLTEARRLHTQAQAALDQAEDHLANFDLDYRQQVVELRGRRAEVEVTLDRARETVSGFDVNYREEIANARMRISRAEEATIQAQDDLYAFILPIGVTTTLHDPRIEDGADPEVILDSPLDVMQRLRTDVEEAQASLAQARTHLTDLEGNRELRLQERKVAVSQAEAVLARITDNLAELEGNRGLRLQEREVAVLEAEAVLVQAEDNLADLEQGPDSFLQRSLQASLEADRAALEQAELNLARLLEGPDEEDLTVLRQEIAQWKAVLNDLFEVDPLEVAALEVQLATIAARLEDTREDLDGAALRAPFAGVVSLVNVETEDLVSDQSRVLTVVDPSVVQIAGVVDATRVRYVREGADARVTIASMPERELAGTVTHLAVDPRTERGVVSHAMTIEVHLPPGMEVQVTPTAVSVLVSPSGS